MAKITKRKIDWEKLESEIEVMLYGIVDEFNAKLERLGKAQAQYAILGMGANKIVNLMRKALEIAELKKEIKGKNV